MNSEFNYCLDLVRKRDKDRYLCAILAPKERLRQLMALFAFHAEMEEIPASVSEPLIGQMRLKWWLDQLDNMYAGTPPQHPVAKEFSALLQKVPLNRSKLENYIELQADQLTPSQPRNFADFMEASKTTVHLQNFAAEVEIPQYKGPMSSDELIAGSWRLLQAVLTPRRSNTGGVVPLPSELESKHKFSFQSSSPSSDLPNGLKAAFKETSQIILERIEAAREASRQNNDTFHTGQLLTVLAEAYVNHLAQNDYNPAVPRLRSRQPAVGTLVRLKWQAWRRRF